MKKVFILDLSQLLQANLADPLALFAQHSKKDFQAVINVACAQGMLYPTSYAQEEIAQTTQGAIYLYKVGAIDDAEFIKRTNAALGADIDTETFKLCWNSMYKLRVENLELLTKLQQLQQESDFGLHLMSNISKMQADYIFSQLRDANIDLKMSHTFSFEEGKFDPEVPVIAAGEAIDLRSSTNIIADIESRLGNSAKSKPVLGV